MPKDFATAKAAVIARLRAQPVDTGAENQWKMSKIAQAEKLTEESMSSALAARPLDPAWDQALTVAKEIEAEMKKSGGRRRKMKTRKGRKSSKKTRRH